MTPQEAIDLVVQVTDRFLGTKKDHENLNVAILMLKEAVLISKEVTAAKPNKEAE